MTCVGVLRFPAPIAIPVAPPEPIAEPEPVAPKWSALAPPVDPLETTIRARAQSLLTGSLVGGLCPVLTIEQARDVLAWANQTETK